MPLLELVGGFECCGKGVAAGLGLVACVFPEVGTARGSAVEEAVGLAVGNTVDDGAAPAGLLSSTAATGKTVAHLAHLIRFPAASSATLYVALQFGQRQRIDMGLFPGH